MTRQQTIDKAVEWAVATAENPAHGYDQAHRFGPDYDCSSFVISAWEAAGVPVKQAGATYTGNMYAAFVKCGFANVTPNVNLYTGAGLKSGDVLLNVKNHTEMYIGDGKVVKASINEKGTITGGQTGDQNGREICVGNYYNYPWDYVLRYVGDGADGQDDDEPTPVQQTCAVELPILRKGDANASVIAAQVILIRSGYSCGWWGSDGEFGDATENALKKYQKSKGLAVDGIVGKATWDKLLKG